MGGEERWGSPSTDGRVAPAPAKKGLGAWAGPAVPQLWTERWRGPRPR